MSNPLAIAAVTKVLKKLMDDSISWPNLSSILGNAPTVSALPPDRIDTGANSPNRINLFLFQAVENQGWRNANYPSRDVNGERLSNPKLALDLHYLVTAYGSADFQAEVLLGLAMFALHESATLTRQEIRDRLGPLPPPPPNDLNGALASTDLADQIELIKIVPQVMNVEEISKIWSALQSQYRPTAVYNVSVVLIESTRPVRASLPVRARNLMAIPFQFPVIEQVLSQSAANQPIVAGQPILAGYNLVLRGNMLRAETTRVLVDDHEITPTDDAISDTQVIVPLPAGLLPGLHAVQIVHRLDFKTGDASEPHRGTESNSAAFMLSPSITTPPPITVARGATLTLDLDPAVGRAQRVALVVGGRSIPIPARSATGPPTAISLDFAIPNDLSPGPALLRVQVDDAPSPLRIDGGGRFVSPSITIT